MGGGCPWCLVVSEGSDQLLSFWEEQQWKEVRNNSIGWLDGEASDATTPVKLIYGCKNFKW